MAGIDEFLQHRAGGSRGAYLTKWKKDGKVNTWLHTERLPMAVWRHGGIPRVVVLDDRQTNESVRHIWSGDWVCAEDESVLREQYSLDDKGAREHPPEHCAICRMNDYIRRLVTAGRMPWTEPVFRFEGDVETETQTLFAGGMFMTRKFIEALDAEEIKAARKLGVDTRELWKQNCYAKCEYLFCVVDDAHPESGVQKAFNPSSLGDAVKNVISDMRESKGVEEGDPTQNPYCIQWQYREKETDPKKKYHALPVEKVKLTDGVKELIYGVAPDISKDIRPFNVIEMRAFLEEHALVKLPWKDIFDVKVRAVEEPKATPPRAKPKPAAEEEPEPTPAKGAKKRGTARAKFPEDDDPKAVACEAIKDDGEECGLAIWEDETMCPHCGAEYEQNDKGVYVLKAKEKPKAGPKRRGAVPAPAESQTNVAPKKITKAKAPAPPPSAPVQERHAGDDEEEDLDELPF